MQEEVKKESKTKYKILGAIGVIVLIIGLTRSKFLPEQLVEKDHSDSGHSSTIKSVMAQEIQPFFECPCCGKPINECTCPMAKERMAFVEGLTSSEISEEDAVMAYIRKYGLESFLDENKMTEYKEKLIELAPEKRAIISVNPTSYDFGDVSQKEGIATTLFKIENQGESDLIINKMETSCGCTSASIIHEGEEGPKFNMPGHGINEEIGEWQVLISPGEKADLKVYYDPDVHGDFRGTAIRTVSIFSNDPIDFEKKVEIELNQVE